MGAATLEYTGANDGIKTPARMMDPYAVEIFGFTVLSVALSTICTYLDPRADQVFDGFPRPKFVASIVWQLIVFPATVWLMIRSDQPQGTDEWLVFAAKGRAAMGGIPCYYFPALIAAQLKDVVTGTSATFSVIC